MPDAPRPSQCGSGPRAKSPPVGLSEAWWSRGGWGAQKVGARAFRRAPHSPYFGRAALRFAQRAAGPIPGAARQRAAAPANLEGAGCRAGALKAATRCWRGCARGPFGRCRFNDASPARGGCGTASTAETRGGWRGQAALPQAVAPHRSARVSPRELRRATRLQGATSRNGDCRRGVLTAGDAGHAAAKERGGTGWAGSGLAAVRHVHRKKACPRPRPQPPQSFLPTTFAKDTYLPAFAASVIPNSTIFLGDRPTISPLARTSSSSGMRVGKIRGK